MVATHKCDLLGGWFGYGIQFGLAVAAVFTLLVKRHYEVPQRPFQVWFFDASKQGIGAGVAHFLNMCMAWILVTPQFEDQVIFFCAHDSMFYIEPTVCLVFCQLYG